MFDYLLCFSCKCWRVFRHGCWPHCHFIHIHINTTSTSHHIHLHYFHSHRIHLHRIHSRSSHLYHKHIYTRHILCLPAGYHTGHPPTSLPRSTSICTPPIHTPRLGIETGDNAWKLDFGPPKAKGGLQRHGYKYLPECFLTCLGIHCVVIGPPA